MGMSDTSAWKHSSTTCADLNTNKVWGSDDWIKIPLIDNKEPQEGGECCGRTAPACSPSIPCCPGDKHTDLGGANDKCPCGWKMWQWR